MLLALLAGGEPANAPAHDLFTTYVQHRVQLVAGARHLDLTVDLTFFEEWSARERRAMDADADGRISRAEADAYRAQLADRLARAVTLRLAGREVPLATLYDPELDLLGNDQAIPGHHRLRLFFFAPTPAGLRPNDELAIEDRLWPEANALVTLRAEGRDGCALEAERVRDPVLPPARPGETRAFKVRCLQPPGTETGAGRPAAPQWHQAAANPAAPCSRPAIPQPQPVP